MGRYIRQNDKREVTKMSFLERNIKMGKPVVKASAIELARKYALDRAPFLEKLTHLDRLSNVTGRDYSWGWNSSLLQKLILEGFRLIVNGDYVMQFPYAASIRGIEYDPVRTEVKVDYIPETKGVIYKGDIPDFALQKAGKAVELGIESISLHSMEPMLVELVTGYNRKLMPGELGTLRDPVMIGWINNPKIEITLHPPTVDCPRQAIGVIIAIWLNDKEEI